MHSCASQAVLKPVIWVTIVLPVTTVCCESDITIQRVCEVVLLSCVCMCLCMFGSCTHADNYMSMVVSSERNRGPEWKGFLNLLHISPQSRVHRKHAAMDQSVELSSSGVPDGWLMTQRTPRDTATLKHSYRDVGTVTNRCVQLIVYPSS